MVKILDIMVREQAGVATGHISKAEVFAVVKEARRRKINVIVTHRWPDLPVRLSL